MTKAELDEKYFVVQTEERLFFTPVQEADLTISESRIVLSWWSNMKKQKLTINPRVGMGIKTTTPRKNAWLKKMLSEREMAEKYVAEVREREKKKENDKEISVGQ